MLGDSTLEVKRIVINSYGSPSGAYDNNAKATRKQSDKLRRRLVNRYHVPESKITILNVAEDWSGLENLINNSEVVLQNRDGVLRIVKDNSLSPDEKEEMLKKNYKEDWKYLEKHFFNKLERVSFTLDYNQPDYDIIYRDGYEYRIKRTKQEPCASQSNECQKVQNSSCEAARTPISDTKSTDASMTFLVDKAEIPAVFNGNQQNLDQITVKLNSLISDSAVSLQRIIVSGYASPDGLFKKNAKLALNRTNLLKNYIANRYNVPDSLLETHAVAEDWEGLEQAVLKTPDSDLPNKQAILNIIRSNYAPDVKERKIKAFKADFAYLKENILPKLRRFEYCIQYIKDGEVTNTTVVAQIEPDTAMPLIDDRTKRELLADASQEQPVVATTTDALSTDENEPLPAPTDAANAAQFVESQKVRDNHSYNSESLITDTIQADALVAFLINEAEMRADVDGNKEYMEQISSQLDQVINDTTIRLQRIIVSGYASPDGPYQKNAKLAQSRTDILKDFIVNRSNISNSLLETHAVPEDWDGLEQAVLNTPDSDLPHKQAILGIIGSSEKLDVKERKIRALRTDFNYLKENVLPKLRRSEYYIQYFKDVDVTNTTVVAHVEPDTVMPLTDGVTKRESYTDASSEQPVVATTAKADQSIKSQKVHGNRFYTTETLITDTIQADALVAFLINESEMRADVDGNKEYIEQICSQLDQVINDTTIRLQRIIVSGYASPDGPYQKNAKLAQSRTDILKDFIVNRSNISNSLLETHAVPEDWDGLEQAVLNTPDSDLPHKQAILGIIGSSEKLDVKERKIRALRTDFNYLKENVLPKLRRTEFYIQYFKDTRLINTTVIEEEQPDTVTAVEEQPAKKKPFYIAAKTNLLYDAALVPNIGVELYLGKQWTVSADWFYNWWYSDSRHYYWQGYGGYLGVRKYFGSKSEENPFTGHHVGLYGLMMTYDVEWGNRGYQMPDWGFGGGLEYGYSMPIARRLNLDFSLGIGYQDGTYKEYLPLDGHYVWQSTHKRHWIGPTKAEISLKWLIGRGNYHKNYGKNTVI